MKNQVALALPLAATAAALLGWGSAAIAQAGPEPEDPGPLPTSRFLPPEAISGPHWEVGPTVTSDGVSLTYSVSSRFGTWEAHSHTQVERRIGEIVALDQLDKISRTQVFQDAVRNAVVAPLNLVQDFANRPVKTLKAVPASVGRWFRKTRFEVKERYSEARDKLEEAQERPSANAAEAGDESAEPETASAKNTAQRVGTKVVRRARRALGITSAERRWFQRLAVDPYTDNELLRESIRKVARVEGLTGFAVQRVGLPEIPGTSELSDVMDLVWRTDPWEIRRRNRESLLSFEVDEDAARIFENAEHLSLTLQTILIEAIRRLDGVERRDLLVDRAVEAEDRDGAEMLLAAVDLLADIHEHRSPLKEILAGTRIPVARTLDESVIAATAREALFWSLAVSNGATDFADAYRDLPSGTRTLWTDGTASERFREGLQHLGWSVRDGVTMPE